VKQRAESKIFKLKGRSRALIGGLGAAALFLLISILLNFAMVFGVVDGQVATTVPADSALLEVKGSDRIVQTAAAEEALPLAIAPLLDEATRAAEPRRLARQRHAGRHAGLSSTTACEGVRVNYLGGE
jgi:hypothetical protein